MDLYRRKYTSNMLLLPVHWPCIADNSNLSTYGTNSLRKGDEHTAYAPLEYGRHLPFM